jgi:hypothetical protein
MTNVSPSLNTEVKVASRKAETAQRETVRSQEKGVIKRRKASRTNEKGAANGLACLGKVITGSPGALAVQVREAGALLDPALQGQTTVNAVIDEDVVKVAAGRHRRTAPEMIIKRKVTEREEETEVKRNEREIEAARLEVAVFRHHGYT